METSKVRTERENMMAKDEQNKCAHLPCRCVIQTLQRSVQGSGSQGGRDFLPVQSWSLTAHGVKNYRLLSSK
jgi:hypothetical protein